MKFLLVLLFSIQAFAQQGVYVTNGLQSNPTANTVLAQSPTVSGGVQSGAYFQFNFVCANGSASPSNFAIQVMNGATVVSTQYMVVPANDTRYINFSNSFLISNGNLVRIINPAAITGSVQCSFSYSVDNFQ